MKDFPDSKVLEPLRTTLETLDVGDNMLSELKDYSLQGLENLYGLRLAENNITTLTVHSFAGAENLRMLNLASNTINSVDRNSLTPLKKLEALRLDQNNLEDINGLLTDQTHLKWLNVSNNRLQWFDYACVPKSVKLLYLRGNLIDDLANYYEMTGFQLIRMDVGQNKLQRLDRASLQSSLKEVRWRLKTSTIKIACKNCDSENQNFLHFFFKICISDTPFLTRCFANFDYFKVCLFLNAWHGDIF